MLMKLTTGCQIKCPAFLQIEKKPVIVFTYESNIWAAIVVRNTMKRMYSE